MKERPYNKLFLVQSLDGKISTGWTDNRDWDKDIPGIPGMKNGMDWYYAEERGTDYWSLITDRTALKLGAAQHKFPSEYHQHGCILWDRGRLLSVDDIRWLSQQYQDFIVVQFTDRIDWAMTDVVTAIDAVDAFEKLSDQHDVRNITVQSGGTLNSVLLRAGLIDEVEVFIAPVIIGGKTTPTLVDGNDIIGDDELNLIKQMELVSVESRFGFVRVKYKVNNKQSKVTDCLNSCV